MIEFQVPRVIVMVLANVNNDPRCKAKTGCQDPTAEAELLRKQGVTIIVVAILTSPEVYAEALKMTSPEHIIALDSFQKLTDLSPIAKVVSKACESPALLTPGETISGTLRRCEMKSFIAPCPVPRYATRVATDVPSHVVDLYTAYEGLASPVNFAQSIRGSSADAVLQTITNGDGNGKGDQPANDGKDKAIRISILGAADGSTTFYLDSWFDRYNGYMGEVLAASKVTNAFKTGAPLYECPNDGNRDVYFVNKDDTHANCTIQQQTGIVEVGADDMQGTGTARIRVEHPTLQCYTSFIDIKVEKVEVSGQIYIDYDGSGQQERGEAGVGGLKVALQSRHKGPQATVTAITDSMGVWRAGVDFGVTRLKIDTEGLKLQVTEGYADFAIDVTAKAHRFPKVGVRALTTTTTTATTTTTTRTSTTATSTTATTTTTTRTSTTATSTTATTYTTAYTVEKKNQYPQSR